MRPPSSTNDAIDAVRQFNRFYTKKIGVLDDTILHSRFSLAEVRVLFELAHTDSATAGAVAGELGLDPGYMSRIVRRLEKEGLVDRGKSAQDGRRSMLSLTQRGKATFAGLDASARSEVGAILATFPALEQARLIDALKTVRRLLGDPSADSAPFVLRLHRPGDMGWIVHRHGVLYSQEYGWDERFEALVAAIVAEFIEHEDPKLDRCWIAEREGVNVGSIMLVKESKRIARLRLFLVEPSARGLGIGTRLVEECTRFARSAGYRKIVLWTQDVLREARRIYTRAGFQHVKTEPHDRFGTGLKGETWEFLVH
jgi:DNA-binding MarR family transcriptional regulator/GNAT superfamily N-acetyltransferase